MTNWYYTDTFGTRLGPIDDQQLQGLVARGIITPETLMETDTGHEGVAGKIPGLFEPAYSLPTSSEQSTQMFCTNCGNPVAEHAAACMVCGASPIGHKKFCWHCGTALNSEQVFCVQCGSAIDARSVGNALTGYSGAAPVPDYFIWSIIMTLCACLPLGVAAIVFSALCKIDLSAGRYESAAKNSKIAFWCNVVNVIFILCMVVFYIVILGVAVLTEGM